MVLLQCRHICSFKDVCCELLHFQSWTDRSEVKGWYVLPPLSSDALLCCDGGERRVHGRNAALRWRKREGSKEREGDTRTQQQQPSCGQVGSARGPRAPEKSSPLLCAHFGRTERKVTRKIEGKVPPALPAATTVNRESPAGRQKCILSVVVGTRWSRGRWFIRSSFFKGQRALRVTFCTCASSKGGLTKINIFIIFRLYL